MFRGSPEDYEIKDYTALLDLVPLEIVEEIKKVLMKHFPYVGFALAWHLHILILALGGESLTPKERLAKAIGEHYDWNVLMASVFSDLEKDDETPESD